jgi:hypothetical protein
MRLSQSLALAICFLAFATGCSKSPTLTAPGTVGGAVARSANTNTAYNSYAATPARSTNTTNNAAVNASRASGKAPVQVDSAPDTHSSYSNEDISAEIARQGSADPQDSWE